jgi:hypothetical protein
MCSDTNTSLVCTDHLATQNSTMCVANAIVLTNMFPLKDVYPVTLTGRRGVHLDKVLWVHCCRTEPAYDNI